MKRKLYVAVVLFTFLSLLVGGMGMAQGATSGSQTPPTYAAVFSHAAATSGISGTLGPITRKQITGNIYEYSTVIKVGPGPYDQFGLHRVVKETASGIPAITSNAVMMIHGDAGMFDLTFNPYTQLGGQSLAVALAEDNVDVWGMDLRYTLVPASTTNFSFMKNWNTALYLSDMKIAVTVCRTVRGLTGNGFGKIIMLGHSRGAQLTYAYANQDAVRPAMLQDLKGIIPMDFPERLDTSVPAFVYAQGAYNMLETAMATGTYDSTAGQFMSTVSGLALAYPKALSPVFPPYNNYQACLAALTTVTSFHAGTPGVPFFLTLPPQTQFFHLMAGTFDPTTQLPTGLQFAPNPSGIFAIGTATPPYQSLAEQADGEAIMLGLPQAAPYDSNLGKIKIPVFYIGAGGGVGSYGTYGLKLLGSTNKQSLIVNTYTADNDLLNYGHMDLLYANNASVLVWTPICQWINSNFK